MPVSTDQHHQGDTTMEAFDSTAPVRVRRGWRVGAVAVAGLLLLTAGGGIAGASVRSAGASDTALLGKKNPAKGEPVQIGMISEGTSASADASYEIDGFDVAVKWINDRRGGIAGRPIELLKCETRQDAGRAAECANQMITAKVPAVIMGGSSNTEAVWQPLHDAGIPVMMAAASADKVLTDPDSTFVLADPYAAVVDLPLGIAKKAKTKKVSGVVIDVPAAVGILQDETVPKMKKAGITMEVIPIAPGTPDMTPQMQELATNGTGEAFVIGSDAFCIAAFNGLHAVAYKGKVAAVSQCVTDATRKAVPGDVLKGTIVSATAPVGANDPSIKVFEAVAKAYNPDLKSDNTGLISTFATAVAFADAVKGITGEITPANVITTVRAAKEQELVASGGQKFRCNSKANPAKAAICIRGTLVTTLDATGHPKKYEVVGASPIPD